MKINSIEKTQSSFSKTLSGEFRSSTDIENVSFIEKYENKELPKYLNSSQNLKEFTNLLMTKYYNKIRSTCSFRTLSKEENTKYRYRPEALSSDVYGTVSLWYLILKVNSCEDFSEFYDLPYVLLPDINVISECMLNEEYILKKDIQ